MTPEVVYLLIYDDQEGGGDIYHRIFLTAEAAEKALSEIRDEVLKHNLLDEDDRQEYIARGDYTDETRYFYLVDAASIDIVCCSLE